MRRTTSVIHNTKKEMQQSVEAITQAQNELLPRVSSVVGARKDNPEITLVQVCITIYTFQLYIHYIYIYIYIFIIYTFFCYRRNTMQHTNVSYQRELFIFVYGRLQMVSQVLISWNNGCWIYRYTRIRSFVRENTSIQYQRRTQKW